ncbi:hypothetical protein CYL20_09020 [Pseudomonas palleroniana]|uniref:Uncharacterized protein n=1 Tax=Pseudomonas palleroniana TaxID=191390 RepID=A0A2L1J877_9PSED|nr:hypothetical protein CYL20_09020 [Pseudomonas palleroniana]
MYTFVSFTVVELFEKVWQTPMVILKLPSAVDNRQQSAKSGRPTRFWFRPACLLRKCKLAHFSASWIRLVCQVG